MFFILILSSSLIVLALGFPPQDSNIYSDVDFVLLDLGNSDFDSDVADSNTDTTVDDLQQDVAIEVASLQVFGKTK